MTSVHRCDASVPHCPLCTVCPTIALCVNYTTTNSEIPWMINFKTPPTTPSPNTQTQTRTHTHTHTHIHTHMNSHWKRIDSMSLLPIQTQCQSCLSILPPACLCVCVCVTTLVCFSDSANEGMQCWNTDWERSA